MCSTRAQMGHACFILCLAGGNARAEPSAQRTSDGGAEASSAASPSRPPRTPRVRPTRRHRPAGSSWRKVAAGILHGYTGEFQNKIPLNSSGVAPAIVPSVGYCINRFCSELVVFGTAGVLVTVGVTVP